MGRPRNMLLLLLVSLLAVVFAIPTSLVEEIKSSEMRENKVKRAHPANPEENSEVTYFNKPSAIKRGANLKNPSPEQEILNEWNQAQDQAVYQNADNLANIQSGLFGAQENPFDEKTIAEYEKGFQYGINKDKLDQALENAVLKSEYYGDPGSVNQYRYYGMDDKKRRRRAIQKLRLNNRLKRDIGLNPEEIITLVHMYEKSHENQGNYQPQYTRYEPKYNHFDDSKLNVDDNEESWLDAPVYPHVNHQNPEIGPQYLFDEPQVYEKRGKWGNYMENKKKRFMVAKKRNDPTRELLHLNGPNQNDFYTLSQILSNQREPEVPVYQRLVL